jgi:regulatory protein
MDRVVARLAELKYLSDERFAQDYTRMRKENQGFGRRRVGPRHKSVGKEFAAKTLETLTVRRSWQGLYCTHKRIQKPVRRTIF